MEKFAILIQRTGTLYPILFDSEEEATRRSSKFGPHIILRCEEAVRNSLHAHLTFNPHDDLLGMKFGCSETPQTKEQEMKD